MHFHSRSFYFFQSMLLASPALSMEWRSKMRVGGHIVPQATHCSDTLKTINLLHTGVVRISVHESLKNNYESASQLCHFSPKDGDSMYLRNTGICLRKYTAPKSNTLPSSPPLWKPKYHNWRSTRGDQITEHHSEVRNRCDLIPPKIHKWGMMTINSVNGNCYTTNKNGEISP
jgi:hypothetical protein